jgi:hypothetical protein
VPPLKACEVLATDDGTFVFSLSVTERGAAVADGPYFRLDAAIDPVTLGETVLTAIEASRLQVPHPADLKGVEKKLVAFTGYRSWRQLAQSVVGFAAVGLDGEEALIIPHEPGPRDSFLGVDDRSVRCPANAMSIGRTLITMLGPSGTERLT